MEVVLQRKSKTNTSDTFINQRHFNWFRLDSDGSYKEHKCTSNISLYCGFKELRYAHKCTSAHNNISLYCRFKELSVRGLKTANKV